MGIDASLSVAADAADSPWKGVRIGRQGVKNVVQHGQRFRWEFLSTSLSALGELNCVLFDFKRLLRHFSPRAIACRPYRRDTNAPRRLVKYVLNFDMLVYGGGRKRNTVRITRRSKLCIKPTFRTELSY